ncbi:putative ribonuclease H-like domain-containing protein [Tanacetum coccineum]|uniref:Ribonuclease H-like domain-containing protein n=1 Tax=Tanacetum coccineum TaxID=301880 RepID=A0ABQ5EEF9_9ASTR
MTSPNKPTSKPSRVAKISVKPIWRMKPNLCNTSNVLNANSPTPMPKPLTPHHENNHPNQALPNPYIKDTTTSPQVVSHPPFPISPINSHVTHTHAPPQSDNQTQHTPPLSLIFHIWYPKDSAIVLTTFSYVDHAGCQDTRHSTSGSMQFLRDRLSFRLDHSLSTMALDSIKFQCNMITKGLLPSAATMFNIPADIFTNALGKERIVFLINKLGMRSFTPETLKQLADEVDAFMPVSPIPTTKVHKDHPIEQIIGDLNSAPQTRRMTKNLEEHGTKWVFKNKNDERGIVIKNKARLVAQGTQGKKGIGYDEMDVKSAFLYGKIKEESLCLSTNPGLKYPDFLTQGVYKVEKALYGLHEAPRAWYETLSTYLLDNGFQRGKIDKTLFIKRDKGLQVKQKEDGIFISQDKYVTEILKKFGFTDVKKASTPMETQKILLKDEDGEEVDVHLYRSMIGSLMYLTSSRPDIMFAVCACARYQVNPKVSHLHAVKRIFRYLKGQPKLGLWYPKDSPFDLVAYTDSDYAGASLDRKSTIGGCQFLGCRLISWQCKKQTVVANSTTEAEYVAASSC